MIVRIGTYYSNAGANHTGKCIEDVDGRGQPFGQVFVAGRRLLDLSTKDSQDICGRFAGLQLGHQWMREEVFLRLLLILFHGSIKDGLEIGRRGSSVRDLRHGNSSEERRLF